MRASSRPYHSPYRPRRLCLHLIFPSFFLLSWEILRGGIPGNAGCCQRDADRHQQEPCRVPLSGSLTRAASGFFAGHRKSLERPFPRRTARKTADPPAPRRDPQGGLPLLSHAPSAPAGRSPSFRLDAPGRTAPPEEQGGSGCFPPHARPSSQPGRSPRPAGNPRGPKRSAEAALRALLTFNPHPQSLGRNLLTPPRFGGGSAPFPTCPSPLARGEGLNRSAPQDVPRGWGVGLPRSAVRHPAPAAPGFVSQATPSHPHHSGQAPQDMPRGPARWCPGPRPSRPPAPPAAPCTGPHRATPSRRSPEAGPVSPQGKPTQPNGFPGKARQNRSANLARLHNERGVRGEIMPAFGGAVSLFFFSRRQGGES